MLIAVGGFLLSYTGASDIRNAEGTKAGAKLASWGMGLSLVCGLGYFAYSYFTGLALAQQSNAFVMEYGEDSGFVPRLQKAATDKVELNRDFLLTLPAFDRSGMRPEDNAAMIRHHDQMSPDGQPGKLTRFKIDNFVQALVQGGPDVKVEPLGVQEWKFEKRSYQVTRLYRIQTPHAVMSVVLTTKSSEGESEGQTRSWFVDLGSTYRTQYEATPLGRGIESLRMLANARGHQLGDEFRKGKFPDLAKLDQTDWAALPKDGLGADEAQARLRKLFAGDMHVDRWQYKPKSFGPEMWETRRDDAGRFVVRLPVMFAFLNPGASTQSAVDGIIDLRTTTSVDPAQVDEEVLRTLAWDVAGIEFTRVYPVKRP